MRNFRYGDLIRVDGGSIRIGETGKYIGAVSDMPGVGVKQTLYLAVVKFTDDYDVVDLTNLFPAQFTPSDKCELNLKDDGTCYIHDKNNRCYFSKVGHFRENALCCYFKSAETAVRLFKNSFPHTNLNVVISVG